MSIEDEIRRTKERMQNDMNEQERRRIKAENWASELKAANMKGNEPVLIYPPNELKRFISEVLPKLEFKTGRVVKTMSDGRTFVRPPMASERANAFAYVYTMSNGTGKGSVTYMLSIFNNGAIAFSNGGSNIDWTMVQNTFPATTIRNGIIEDLAHREIEKEKNNPQKTSSGSKEGCYIATAVYGSYDCPEVWVLRRYRDHYLKKTVLGKLFVKLYYSISPKLVKIFGNNKKLKNLFKNLLDRKVTKLKEKGLEDTNYYD